MSATTESVDRLVAGLWDDLLRLQPVRGTFVGDTRHDHRLPDPSDAGRADAETVFTVTLLALADIDRDACDPATRTTVEIAEAICRTEQRLQSVRMDRWELVSHMAGPATTLGVVASLQGTDTPQALDAYEARLHDFPRYLDAWEAVGREALDAGVVAPRIVVERTLSMLDRILGAGPEDSPALAALRDGDRAARDRITTAARESVIPAHTRFRDFLRTDYLPAAPATTGLVGTPGAEELYAAAIQASTSLDMDPHAVHALGLDRLASIDAERGRIAAALGYPDATTAVADRAARGENTIAEDDLLGFVGDQVARSWEAAPAFFGRLPSANCQVRLVEEFRAAETPFAFYNSPTEDGSRPGTYYVNPYGIAERPLHHLAGVTFHEANPGHHFQVGIEMEMGDLPPLRRFASDLAGGAFAEGWGLYAERLADEMGLYLDDWERLGMLENQAHRAARLVVDTGLHALGWDRDRAIAMMLESGLSPIDAAVEVDRYIAMPGQALCYMIGMIEIERARDVAMAAGTPLQTFHDEVLAQGQLPLPVFRRVFGLS